MENSFDLSKLSKYQNGTYADIINRHAILSPDGVAFIYWSAGNVSR